MPTKDIIVHFNQPRFLPALNYFQRMLLVDIFVYRDDVQYQSKDWENRNKIKVGQGQWAWLTVPIQKSEKGTRITDALIDDSMDWRSKMCKSVYLAYKRADHFKTFFPQFEALILAGWKDQPLVTLNYALIDMFREAWRLDKCSFVLASELGCEGNTDTILLRMCEKLGAKTYLSGAEGRNYNVPERWAKAGIDLRYHDYQPVHYRQQHNYFMQWMCALDLLLNCGRDRGREVLQTIPMDVTSL